MERTRYEEEHIKQSFLRTFQKLSVSKLLTKHYNLKQEGGAVDNAFARYSRVRVSATQALPPQVNSAPGS